MIETILPDGVAAAEAFDDETPVDLFPAEEEQLSRAVEKRRREFTTGRGCARLALERLGAEPAAIPSGERGEPLWPEGILGSITHCDGYRAGAVARAERLLALGIDAEPHQPLPAGLLATVARPEERAWIAERAAAEPGMHWDRLLFSAKESVYKAWFPLARRWLGFEDASLVVDPERRRFSARLLVSGPVVEGSEIDGFEGRWLVENGLVVSAIAVSR